MLRFSSISGRCFFVDKKAWYKQNVLKIRFALTFKHAKILNSSEESWVQLESSLVI